MFGATRMPPMPFTESAGNENAFNRLRSERIEIRMQIREVESGRKQLRPGSVLPGE